MDFESSKSKLRNLSENWQNKIPIITGYIGKSKSGKTTTLGRNGSDYTATMIAASLKATIVIINTDISGVMTADPNIVQSVKPVDELTHKEAIELAIYGTG